MRNRVECRRGGGQRLTAYGCRARQAPTRVSGLHPLDADAQLIDQIATVVAGQQQNADANQPQHSLVPGCADLVAASTRPPAPQRQRSKNEQRGQP